MVVVVKVVVVVVVVEVVVGFVFYQSDVFSRLHNAHVTSFKTSPSQPSSINYNKDKYIKLHSHETVQHLKLVFK